MHRTNLDDLLAALRSAGMRITKARRVICEVLAAAPEAHLSAADILSRSSDIAGDIDQSTVYRTLEALEELGFLHHVHLGHGAGAYHLTPQADHHHLVCEVCGRTDDVPMKELGPTLAVIREKYGFVADSPHFAILGRCAAHAAE